MTEKLKAKFGDLVENGWASERNPTRSGIFVREFRRPHGRMNAGLTWEITDGKGKFWELSPVGDHKITVTALFFYGATASAAPDAAALVEGQTKANPARKSVSCNNPWCGGGRLCVRCEARLPTQSKEG